MSNSKFPNLNCWTADTRIKQYTSERAWAKEQLVTTCIFNCDWINSVYILGEKWASNFCCLLATFSHSNHVLAR